MIASIAIRKKEIISSYLSQIFQYGSSLFILPIILNKIPAEELAIWYVFLTITMFVNLLDFGFLPTATRYASFVFGGAQDIVVGGVGDCVGDKVNYQLLKTLILVVRIFYALLAIGVFIALIISGYYYVYPIILTTNNVNNVLIAWSIYTISSCFSVYYCYYAGFIMGRGLIYQYQMIVIASKIIYIFISVLGVIFNYGIIAIAIANMISVIFSRILENIIFYDKELNSILKFIKINRSDLVKYLILICKSSYKLGLVSVGAFLILRANILLSAKFLDLQQIAKYGLSLQIVQIIVAMSSVLYNTQTPKFHQLRVEKNSEGLLRHFSQSIVVAWAIYLLGAVIFFFLGNSVLSMMRSNVFFLDKNELLVLLLASLLELNHSLFANFITTKNIVPFVGPSLISGFVICIFSYIILASTNYGILGLLLVQLVVQLIYNNWKWPVVVLNDFNIGIVKFAKTGFCNLLLMASIKPRNIDM